MRRLRICRGRGLSPHEGIPNSGIVVSSDNVHFYTLIAFSPPLPDRLLALVHQCMP